MDTSSLSLILQAGVLVIEGEHTDQAGAAFYESLLAGPDPLIVLHVLFDGTQGHLL